MRRSEQVRRSNWRGPLTAVTAKPDEVSLVRIFLVDDNAIARDALRRALQQRSEWIVVGEAYNGRHAVDTFHLHMPHITVMDFIMPELNGLEASRHLFRQYPDVLILLVTTEPSRELEREARRAGIRGVSAK